MPLTYIKRYYKKQPYKSGHYVYHKNAAYYIKYPLHLLIHWVSFCTQEIFVIDAKETAVKAPEGM